MKYRKEIDGLRALAVIPVILCHGDFTAFSGGYIGVDIFFVISGYLITTIIVTEREGGFFSLLNFYERRARRILPALFFMMFCTLPFAMFWLLPTDLYLFSESLVAVPLFASNILFYLTSGYFDTAAELKPLLHTWSLAVEEQYYLLYPLLLLSVWGLGKRWIFSLILIAAVISLLFAHSVYLTHPTFTFFLLPTRAFELLIGGLLAFYLHPDRHPILINQSVSQTLSMVGFLLIIYAIVRFDKGTPTTLFYTPVPIVGASLIIIFANNKNLVGQLLSSKMLVQTGLISYSAYLWHQPLFAFAKIRTLDELSVLKLTLLSLISLLFGYLSWKYIEKPFRNKVLITSKTIIICTLLLSSFFIIIGLVGYVNKGFPSRISNEIKDVIYNPQAPLSNQACLNKYPEFKMFTACLLSKNEDPEVVLLGDSHSQHYFKSLSAALNQKSVIN